MLSETYADTYTNTHASAHASALSDRMEAVRTQVPLVHCITNYVTVHDVRQRASWPCGG